MPIPIRSIFDVANGISAAANTCNTWTGEVILTNLKPPVRNIDDAERFATQRDRHHKTRLATAELTQRSKLASVGR